MCSSVSWLLLLWKDPQQGQILQMQSQTLADWMEKISCPGLVVALSQMQFSPQLVFIAARAHQGLTSNLLPTKPFLQSCSPARQSEPVPIQGLFCPRCRDLHFFYEPHGTQLRISRCIFSLFWPGSTLQRTRCPDLTQWLINVPPELGECLGALNNPPPQPTPLSTFHLSR